MTAKKDPRSKLSLKKKVGRAIDNIAKVIILDKKIIKDKGIRLSKGLEKYVFSELTNKFKKYASSFEDLAVEMFKNAERSTGSEKIDKNKAKNVYKKIDQTVRKDFETVCTDYYEYIKNHASNIIKVIEADNRLNRTSTSEVYFNKIVKACRRIQISTKKIPTAENFGEPGNREIYEDIVELRNSFVKAYLQGKKSVFTSDVSSISVLKSKEVLSTFKTIVTNLNNFIGTYESRPFSAPIKKLFDV